MQAGVGQCAGHISLKVSPVAMLRADAEVTDTLGSRTGRPAVLRSPFRPSEDQDGPDRRRPEADRDRPVRRDRTGRSQDHNTAMEWRDLAPRLALPHVDQAPRDRPGASRSGVVGITASVAQRRTHGVQRGLELPGGMIEPSLARRAPGELAAGYGRVEGWSPHMSYHRRRRNASSLPSP